MVSTLTVLLCCADVIRCWKLRTSTVSQFSGRFSEPARSKLSNRGNRWITTVNSPSFTLVNGTSVVILLFIHLTRMISV